MLEKQDSSPASMDPVGAALPESGAARAATNTIDETLYLNSVPGMAETIIEGMGTSLSECRDGDGQAW